MNPLDADTPSQSVTGYFTLPGNSNLPFVYSVRTVRDGGSFCVRTIDVTQGDIKGICFTCTCSFKRPDPTPLDIQQHVNVSRIYEAVLGGKSPAEHRDMPSSEHKWFRDDPSYAKQAYPFPGLHSKKVEMEVQHESQSPLNRRQLHYYAAIRDEQSGTRDANLDACAHLYASDRNSIFFVSQLLGLHSYTMMASLSHTVVFHNATQDHISTVDEQSGKSKWFTQEIWSDRGADGRVMHHSRIWDEKGRHVATTIQDGLLRLDFPDDEALHKVRRLYDGLSSKL